MDGAKLLEQAIHVVRIKTGGTTCRQPNDQAGEVFSKAHGWFLMVLFGKALC
jgi:hypothetical protein